MCVSGRSKTQRSFFCATTRIKSIYRDSRFETRECCSFTSAGKKTKSITLANCFHTEYACIERLLVPGLSRSLNVFRFKLYMYAYWCDEKNNENACVRIVRIRFISIEFRVHFFHLAICMNPNRMCTIYSWYRIFFFPFSMQMYHIIPLNTKLIQ